MTAALLLNTVGEAPITPDDLPGYAVALYDSYLRRPEVLRLSMWFRLEAGADTPEPEALRRANAAKVAAIRRRSWRAPCGPTSARPSCWR